MSTETDVAVLTQRVGAMERLATKLSDDIEKLEGKLDDVKKQNFGIICSLLVGCALLVANLVAAGLVGR